MPITLFQWIGGTRLRDSSSDRYNDYCRWCHWMGWCRTQKTLMTIRISWPPLEILKLSLAVIRLLAVNDVYGGWYGWKLAPSCRIQDDFVDLAYNAYRVNIREFSGILTLEGCFSACRRAKTWPLCYNHHRVTCSLTQVQPIMICLPPRWRCRGSLVDVADSRFYPNSDTLYIKQNSIFQLEAV